MIQPGKPGLPLTRVITLCPCFYSSEHSHHFLAADFVIASWSVMRRTGLPRRHQDIFFSKYKASALWTTNSLATAIHYHICTTLEVNIGNSKYFRCCVHENRNFMRLSNLS